MKAVIVAASNQCKSSGSFLVNGVGYRENYSGFLCFSQSESILF